VRQVQQIGHGEWVLADFSKSNVPSFDRTRPSQRQSRMLLEKGRHRRSRRWQSVMWRPGKLRFLIGMKNPLPIRPAATARQHSPYGAAPVARFATSVGLRPSSVTHPTTLSHHVCRAAKARQFTGNRDRDHIGRFAGAGEPAIARAQPKLRLPGDLADRLGLALQPEPQLTADPGPVKRPPKAPDRVDPLAKHQEYACVYDWEHRPD
jgi:hypothetical protein